MKNLWSDSEAKKIVKSNSKKGISKELALRVYTSRLLGNNKKLVMHGGGNTSVKCKAKDYFGNSIDILNIKGSGWDLGNIEAEGLPAVRLQELLNLLNLDKLTDEEMVNAQRNNLLNSSSPTPSVETLLHAIIPYRFVDHTHSDAILSIVDQHNSQEIIEKIYGNNALFIPYIMPGFILAKKS
jgi:rhamnose utilization protein RhaD (predicted bifunctional aldolase and dehydrogenase)